MTYKKSNTFNKYSLVIGIVAIAAVAMAGYSYFGGSTPNSNNLNNTSSSCPMMKNTNTSTSSVSAGGCGMMGNRTKTQTTPTASAPTTNTNVQTITMDYNQEGALSPETINLQVGKTYKITININTDVYGCMSSMAIPGLTQDIYDIQKGTPVTFTITPSKAGTYEFTCAMGVPQGAKVIVQ